MKHINERHAQLLAMLDDPELNFTFPEQLGHIYRWMRFEFALLKVANAERNLEHWRQLMKNDVDIANFKKQLNRNL